MQSVNIATSLIKGAVSFETDGPAVRPWRLPFERRNLYPSDEKGALLVRASMLAGVRVAVKTDTSQLTLVCAPGEAERQFDLCRDNEIIATRELAAGETDLSFYDLPRGNKNLSIWLPRADTAWLRELRIDDGATIGPVDSRQKRWITYGSSITHCVKAHSPARTWPAVVAREAGMDLTCLGFGGQCHIDSMIARTMRDMPADFISLKLGINVYGHGSLNPRSFKPAVIGFVETLREKHPTTPIALISPIISPKREDHVNAAGFTLEGIRAEVADAAKRIQETDRDNNLYYFDGRSLFGAELADEYLPDSLHPNGDGYELLGRNFIDKVLPVVCP